MGKIKVGIIWSTGYVGFELIKLLTTYKSQRNREII